MVTRGCDGEITIGTHKVAYIDTFDLSINQGSTDISSIGEEWDEYMGTSKSWSGSLSGTLDTADDGQKEFFDALLSAGKVEATLALKVAANVTLSGTAVCTGMSINASHGDKISVSFNYQGSGALTKVA